MKIPEPKYKKIIDFPNDVEIIEHMWIPLSDGTKLSAKIWMPSCAKKSKVPAILEFIPYRKTDVTAYRDSINHGYFAGHGHAAIRVDLRGSGSSEGILKDEYLETELNDAVEIINWIASQHWSNGSVGMMGKSWGGFNALQVAAKKPNALKAIIAVSASDDRYSTDVHFMGGCMLCDNLSWAAEMFAFNACPPDPKHLGDKWKEIWLERLNQNKPWLKYWIENSYRNDYWKHGSVCEAYENIDIPVFVISGWADGYTSTVFKLVKNLKSPCYGLIGPWGHNYPHMGIPGPAMGFLQESLMWWDHWLKGKKTSFSNFPKLRVWLHDTVSPSFTVEKKPGRWVAVNSWPNENIENNYYSLKDLGHTKSTKIHQLSSPLSVGLFSGKWCSFSSTPDLPLDQREEDGGALVFETSPLKSDCKILGQPRVKLRLRTKQKQGQVIARLSDVLPNGEVRRVSYGMLNLCHRESDEFPSEIPSDEFIEVEIKLNHVAQNFAAGNAIRVSLSTSYWPIAWPSPEDFSCEIDQDNCYFRLPEIKSDISYSEELSTPVGAKPLEKETIQPQDYKWQVLRDLGQDISKLKVVKDEGEYMLKKVGMRVKRRSEEIYSYQHNDYNSLKGTVKSERHFSRPNDDWNIKIKAQTVLRADKKYFYIDSDLDAYHNSRRCFSHSWSYNVLREYL